MAVSRVARSQSGEPAIAFYPFGHPTPYTYNPSLEPSLEPTLESPSMLFPSVKRLLGRERGTPSETTRSLCGELNGKVGSYYVMKGNMKGNHLDTSTTIYDLMVNSTSNLVLINIIDLSVSAFLN
jgi:hypothetical protein